MLSFLLAAEFPRRDNVCAAGPDPGQLPLPSAAAELGSARTPQHWVGSLLLSVAFQDFVKSMGFF